MLRSPDKHHSSPNLHEMSTDVNTSQRKRKTPHDADDAIQFFKNEMLSFKTEIHDMFADIKHEFQSLRDQNKTLSSSFDELKLQHKEALHEMSDMKKSIQFVMDDQREGKQHLDELSAKVQRLESTETELNNLKSTLHQIQLSHNKQQQFSRLLNLEIFNLPEFKNENLTNDVINIAKHAGVPLSGNDIDYVSRVQPMQPVAGRPRTVIVKLRNRGLKDNIMAGLRRKRGVTTMNIGIQGQERNLYVNDHLTQYNKQLLKKCKTCAQDKGYSYTWLKNCRIFVRKFEGSPLIKIESEIDLAKIV